MPWSKLESDFTRHGKVKAIPAAERPAAIALFVAILGYCSELLTDGTIPRSILLGLAHEIGIKRPRKVTEKLQEVGLIRQVNGDFFVHDYLDYQQSREQVLAERKAAAERQRRRRQQLSMDVGHGESHGARHNVTPPVTRARMSARAEADADLDQEPSAVDLGTNGARAAHGEELPVDLELARTRLLSKAPDLNPRMLDDFHLPAAAYFAAAEQIDEQRPDHPAKYAFTLFQTWAREGRYTFTGPEPS